MVDRVTNEQLQEAADAAYFNLCLDSAVQYGLIEVVPVNDKGERSADWHYRDSGVNVDRCNEILEKAKQKGIFPKKF